MGEKNVKIIAYIGYERCNILHCLVTTGIKLGKSILVVDNSIMHDLFNFYVANEDNYIEIDKLTVCKDTVLDKESLNEYDYVFIYTGMNVADALFVVPDRIIVSTTYDSNTINNVATLVEELNAQEKPICILRDKATKKLSDATMIASLKVVPSYVRSMEISIDEISSYIGMTHNRKVKRYGGEITSVTKDLIEMLYDEIDQKQLKKILK